MTAPKPPPVDLQDFLDELADEQELERLSTLSHEELLGEMKKEGIDPARGRAAARRAIDAHEKGGAGGAPPAATRGAEVAACARQRARRRMPVTGIVLAAAAAVVLSIGVVKRDAITAWLAPAPTPTQPPLVPPTHEETPQEKAEKLREAAYVNIAKGYFGEANDQLDAAKLLDPTGNETPKVKEAWGKILGNRRDHTGNSKPPLGPVSAISPAEDAVTRSVRRAAPLVHRAPP